MEQVTLETVLEQAQKLPNDDQYRLRLWLDNKLGKPSGRRSIEDIVREQGKRPVSFQELLGPEPQEDDDDDVDEFLRELRELRNGETLRELD